MTQVFAIQKFTVVPVVAAMFISKATFFCDEVAGLYRATIKCYDKDKKFIGNKEVFFTQDEYDAWGTDNEYIYTLICTKLGIVRTSTDLIEIPE